jgi:putative transposase
MRLVEQHIIAKGDPRYKAIDTAAFASKNLYNQATYQIRQAYIHEGKYLPYAEIFHRVKHLECYQALPRKVSNSILIQIEKTWKSFRESLKEWYEHPEKFRGKPKIPGYKHKEHGRFLLIYDIQAIGKRAYKKTGKIVPSGLFLEIETQVPWEALDQVRIVPRRDFYVAEVVYQKEAQPTDVDPSLVAALDPGVNVLAAITSNKPGFVPRLVSGKPIKSRNQYYNKQREHHQKQLAKHQRFTSRKLDQITTKRTRRIAHYLHTASRRIIDLLVEEGIGTLLIGKNRYWKQEVEMGKKNNQQFVQIPHARFIEMLTYKGALVGIQVITHEESYTSKASFLDLDPLPVYDPSREESPTFSGRRSGRWYYASNKRVLHSDVNGSYNILRKVAPTAFDGLGVGGAAVRPRRLAV